ncbi:recombinase family protein [[Clostridium] fimetarium]|uniref:Recombinase zinc beta ribbon domain-containing protein n=1 Tax=[Clostridium] fimetarium TaxID=99656 RepID=A0A1I0NDZ3_9FIRM|nr:recombinase family protein [[Clostridium] fimetarium]SEV99524.1 Recombinase zinc beta ribbon domain-containing protein [[Clostridium] fimetarium]
MNKNTSTNIIYNADIYVRLSKEDGDVDTGNKYESNSISNQKELIKQFLISYPEIKVHAIREDDGYTGTNFNRPGFQLVLQDVKEKKINCIIVKDLSRVGRNYLKVGQYVQEVFPSMGIRFIAINDNYDSLNSVGVDDDIIVPFKNLLNDAYSRDISVKIRSNLEAKRRKGEYTGAFTSFGYKKSEQDNNELVVDDYAAKVVNDIFIWKLDGINQTGIADKLNSLGIPSPMEYKRVKGSNFQCSFKTNNKAKWCAQTVSRILKNDIYIGTLTQGVRSKPSYRADHLVVKNKKDWIIKENAIEPIIDKMNFIRVQEIMERDTRTAPDETKVYAYAGLLFCGDCKHSMIRKTVPGPNGKKYVYFVCSYNKKTSSCKSHSVKEESLNQAILMSIQKHVGSILDMDTILDELSELDFNKRELAKLDERVLWNDEEIAKCKSLKLSLYEDLREEIIDKDEYMYLKQEYQRRIDEAQGGIKHLHEEISQVFDDKGERKRWVEIFEKHKNLDEVSRKVATQLIDIIYVYEDGRISIRFKFQDKFDTCTRYIEKLQKLLQMKREAI